MMPRSAVPDPAPAIEVRIRIPASLAENVRADLKEIALHPDLDLGAATIGLLKTVYDSIVTRQKRQGE